MTTMGICLKVLDTSLNGGAAERHFTADQTRARHDDGEIAQLIGFDTEMLVLASIKRLRENGYEPHGRVYVGIFVEGVAP